jgi:nitrite reductase/ring-hydroxylating ferredoxin subunit
VTKAEVFLDKFMALKLILLNCLYFPISLSEIIDKSPRYHYNERDWGRDMSEQIEVPPAEQPVPGQRKLIRAKGKEIALFNIDGAFYAIDNRCPHSTGPLVKGRLFGTTLTCPWHGSQFEVTTGRCQSGPAETDVAFYPVYKSNDTLLIEI